MIFSVQTACLVWGSSCDSDQFFGCLGRVTAQRIIMPMYVGVILILSAFPVIIGCVPAQKTLDSNNMVLCIPFSSLAVINFVPLLWFHLVFILHLQNL